MPRTTLDIDAPVLRDLKRLQSREKKSLGRLVSELLARSIAERRATGAPAPRFAWVTRPMGVRVDLTDKEAVRRAADDGDDATGARGGLS